MHFLLTAIIVPIVVATGGDDTPDDVLSLRVLNYTCADASQTPDYRLMFAATGSSYSDVPDWEGTLYAKFVNGVCVKTYTEYAGWPPVTSNSATAPAVPSGYQNPGLAMMLDNATGYHHLTSNGCIMYYYDSNTASAWWNAISADWRVLRADGSGMTSSAPVCS